MDKNKVGEFHFVTEPYLLDFRGRVTIPMIGNYLIHVASSHAAERGFGFNDMSERHTAWVLSRLAIEMIEYPAMLRTHNAAYLGGRSRPPFYQSLFRVGGQQR